MQTATKPVRIDISGDGIFLNLRPTLSTVEAAQALGVSRRTVRGYVTSGLLSAVQVGRSYRIRTESVEEVLTLGSAKARSERVRSPDGSWLMPLRDHARDKFRAQLVARLVDQDAEFSAYRAPII